jgi:hypothetical protein
MTAVVGADIESICSKCGDVWHVVVAKVEDKIAKVQCKQCGGLHRHRPPGDKAGGAIAAKRSVMSKKLLGASEPTRSVTAVEADLTKPTQPYHVSGRYEPGDRIDHPKFGTGVVQSALAPGKIEVSFPEGRKVLAAAKPVSTLAPGGRAGPGPGPAPEGEL